MHRPYPSSFRIRRSRTEGGLLFGASTSSPLLSPLVYVLFLSPFSSYFLVLLMFLFAHTARAERMVSGLQNRPRMRLFGPVNTFPFKQGIKPVLGLFYASETHILICHLLPQLTSSFPFECTSLHLKGIEWLIQRFKCRADIFLFLSRQNVCMGCFCASSEVLGRRIEIRSARA